MYIKNHTKPESVTHSTRFKKKKTKCEARLLILNLTVGCVFYNAFLPHSTNLTGNDNQQIIQCTTTVYITTTLKFLAATCVGFYGHLQGDYFEFYVMRSVHHGSSCE
jgi:hypothetical protein